MARSEYCIGVDLGAANIAVGLVRLDTKSIARQFSVKTRAPRSCESISLDIIDVSRKLCRQEGIDFSLLSWIGIATPGIVKDGVVVAAFNLGWENVDFGRILSDLSGKPTYVVNDANAAAYAEALWGSGANAGSLVAFTLGTGVGGGIVIGGRIWEGINGFAAELGHMVIVPDGRPCPCGKRGCLEAYCSARALVKETERQMELHPDSSMWRLTEGTMGKVSGRTSFLARREGDAVGTAIVDEFIDILAIGIANIINAFQPDVVCIGGGISREGEFLLAPLRDKVAAQCFGTGDKATRVVAATFRNDAGIIGAALLGLQDK